MKEKILALLLKKQFVYVQEFDNAFIQTQTKKNLDNIVRNTAVRRTLDRLSDDVTIIYPDNVSNINGWSINPEKISIKAEIFIFSNEDMITLVDEIIEIIENEKDTD